MIVVNRTDRVLFFMSVAVVTVTLMFTAGCGPRRPKRVPVSGQVLIDEQPLRAGFVRVVPEDARPATGEIDADGRFTLSTFDPGDGCVPGTHKAAVIGFEQTGPGAVRWLAPTRYRLVDTSGLVVEIDGPTDSLVIRLKSDPPAGETESEPEPERIDATGDIDPAQL